MKKKVNEHYLEKELFELIKTDTSYFNFVQEGSLDGMWYWNLEAIEDEWLSPRFWEVLGYDPKEKTHSSSEWQDIIFKDDLAKATENFNKHLQDPKHPYDQIVRYKHKNGSTVWIRCRGIAIRDEHGKPIRMLGAHVDITDLKQKEFALIESEQRFHATVQSLDDGVVIHAFDSSIIDFNNRALEILGLSKNQLLGKTASDSIWRFVDENEKPLPEDKYPITLILTNKKPINHLLIGVVQPKNKAIVWVQVNGTPIFDLHGNIKEVVISFFDVSQLKNSIKELAESENRFRNLFEKAPFGYQSLDAAGRFLIVNEKWLEIMGYSEEEVIGKWFGDFLTPDMKAPFEKRFEMFKKSGSVYSEFSMKTKDGNVILVGFDGTASYDDNHEFLHTHCTITDITEINIANEKLNQRNALIEGLFNHMISGVAIYEVINDGSRGSDYIIKDFNNISLKWENKTRDEVVGKALSELHPNIDDSGIIDFFRKVWKTGESITFPVRQYVNGNYNRWHENRIFKLPTGEIVAMYDDVTERVLIEKQRDKEQKDLLTSQKIAKLGTWRMDVKTNKVTWSEELYKMYGFDSTKPVPPYTEHMKLFTEKSWNQLSTALALTRSKGIPYELELEMALKGEARGWVWVRGEAEYDDQGHIVSLTGAAQDITKQKRAEYEIIHAANHDYLTNLYNRRYFVNAFNTFVENKCSSLGLMMIDINGLKIINDAYGHVQGDDAIKRVSNLLRDVFNQDEVIARIGGDEFAVLIPRKNDLQLQNYKDKLFTRSNNIKIHNIPVSLAIGYEILKDTDENIDELLTRAENQLYRHKITVGDSIRNHAIKAILNTLTEKYEEEKIHSKHVSMICKEIGIELGLNKEDIDILELAGMYHDIGKISIPDAILNKPGKLTNEEYDIIKTHTLVGYQILRAADEYSGLAEYALSHHERWDGNGYPKGLSGKDIPLFSRIINIADSFEAMSADRPYHKGKPIEEAILEIKRCTGTQFDPEIANIFIEKVLKHQP